MKVYIIMIFNSLLFDGFGEFLNQQSEILNWYRTGNIYAIVSKCDMKELHKKIMIYFKNEMYLISKISGSETNGLMSKAFWDFINNPKVSGYHN